MPEHERRMIFGMMVGHEGKSRIVYERYTKAGFDPNRDMLQVNVAPPDSYGGMFGGMTGPPNWREPRRCGGLVVDWDLRTTLEGLYAAGEQMAAGGDYAASVTSGRYAGRKMAAYVREMGEPAIDRKQVDKEKARVYSPVKQQDGIGWKELHAGICRVMQNYCGDYRSQEMLKMGLDWLNSIRESEAAKTCARNPHELWRTLECFSRIDVGEAIMHASLARKASSRALNFNRIDYPEMDPPEWNKFVTIRLQDGKVKEGELPFKYWLLPPNAPTYEENYQKHCGL
jgi:succinate dehydrogenase/fumarate reductase flavoprotein subunit